MKTIRHSAAILTGATLLLAGAGILEAHDFWLVPTAFQVRDGAEIQVRGQTSSRFPTSESAVAPERVADARVLSATDEAGIRNLSVSGTSLLIRHRPVSPGQRLVAVTLQPRSVRESAEGFRRYLVLEGAPEALERYEHEGKMPTDSITRRYAKYAKTLVEVGVGGPRAFSRVAGHPAEFVPLLDPATLSPGDTLPVRLLYRGQPLARAHVHAGSVQSLSGEEAERAVTLETDAEGVARVAIDRAGLWNLRALHIVPADEGSSADWDTHWVSFVFSVEGNSVGRSAPAAAESRVLGTPAPGTESDSADVAGVVDRFHGALAAADTAAALRLLAPDVVIQESGGVETLSEYRSHHLSSDIAFAGAVARDRSPIRVQVKGDLAWATSTSTTVGEYRGRAIDSQGAELMVLRRDQEGWRIVAIHWSSRARRS